MDRAKKRVATGHLISTQDLSPLGLSKALAGVPSQRKDQLLLHAMATQTEGTALLAAGESLSRNCSCSL